MSEKYVAVKVAHEGNEENVLATKELLEVPGKKKKASRRYLGVLLAINSALIGPLTSIIVKGLPDYHVFTIASWRFIGMLLPSLLMLSFHKFYKGEDIFNSFKGNDKWKLISFVVVRGILGTFGLIFMYTCLKYLSVADATVITHSQACFVLLVAHLVLGEKCGLIPTICGLGIIAGIFIIARPPLLTGNSEFDADTLKGTLYALAVLFVLTILHVVLRYLRTVHYTVITLTLSIFGTIVTVSWALFLGKLECPRTPADWGMALGLGTASMVAQTFLNIAFKFEDASVISLVMSGSVVFSFGWQWLFFSVIPDKYSIIGGTLVCSAILVVGFRKFVLSRPPEDKLKKQFSFLLF